VAECGGGGWLREVEVINIQAEEGRWRGSGGLIIYA
jgi:hypothetical protein